MRPRPPRRRRPRVIVRYPWWWYASPPWVAWMRAGRRGPEPSPPRWVEMPQIRRYTQNARRALWRHGLLRGAWVDQLSNAGEELVSFINRFHRVPGFHHVVRGYFSGRYQRNVAQLAMRLAERHASDRRSLRFRRALGVGPTGLPVRTVDFVRGRTHHLLLAWPSMDRRAVQQLLRRSVALYGSPNAVRWVFDRSRLGRSRSEITRELRRELRDLGVRRSRAWLEALGRIVLTA